MLRTIRMPRNVCSINKPLLPFKLIFFFILGGFAGVSPYIPIIGKHLGIHVTAMGIVYTAIPIFLVLSNPIIGFLVDFSQNVKIFLIVFLVSSSISYSCVLGLPPIVQTSEEDAYLQIIHSEYPLMNISTAFKKFCLVEMLKEEVRCTLQFERTNITAFSKIHIAEASPGFSKFSRTVNESESSVKNVEGIYFIPFYSQDVFLKETNISLSTLKSMECSPNIHGCESISEGFVSDFSTYQYWSFLVLIIISEVCFVSCLNLSTVACYESLGTHTELYGRQRLFGTIGWGVICSLVGFLNDKITSPNYSFISGFCIMAVFFVIVIIIIYFTHIPKAHISSNMCKDVGKIVTSKKILVFSVGVGVIGALSSVAFVYEFWFLQDIGASQTILGLTTLSACLFSEAPFLFFSGWIVNKLGHFLCFVLVFVAFALRFYCYSILRDPWLVLPIDLLQGVTYGLYHAAMAAFAKQKAPTGLEATLLGIFGALFDGLGFSIGSFFGGYGFEQIGARQTFFICSIISSACILIFLLASYIFRTPKTKEKFLGSPMEMEEMIHN